MAALASILLAAVMLTGTTPFCPLGSMTEGDWNNDGIFNQLDLVDALLTGNYLQGPYASLAKSVRDAEVDAVFDELGLQPLIRPI